MSRDDSIVDDTSSVGNKEDDEDDEEDANEDEKFEGNPGDPERLKAFNVSILHDCAASASLLVAVISV